MNEKVTTINLDQVREFYSRQAHDSDMIAKLAEGAIALTDENAKLKKRLEEVEKELAALKPKEAPKKP